VGIKISHKMNFIGIFAIVAGVLIGLEFLTVGLFATLWAYAVNKDIRVFFGLIGGIAFGVMLLLGGIGVLRRRPSSRVLLIVSFYLTSAAMILFLFFAIMQRLQDEYTDFFSWACLLVFCLFVGTLCVFQALFLNKPDVKELFKKE